VKLLHDPTRLPDSLRHGAVAIGNFDGVHRGHARIIERLLSNARRLGGPALVFTFDPPPARLLRPDRAPPPLTWIARKGELLAELGVDALIAYPTDKALLDLTAREFFDRIVREQLGARCLVEGPNFFFGHDRQGNVDVLRQFCQTSGLVLEVVEPVVIDGQIVSSSRVRTLVSQGRIDEVTRLLTQPYRLRGTIIRGAGRGTGIGYPTANLGHVETLLPGEGLYAGRALVDGRFWPAAINVGPNPTFNEGGMKIEAHLLDFQGDLYGRPVEVDFLARLRDIERFASVELLLAQMARDVEAARAVAAGFLNED
jgi:riboflavin kinase/FMN adenylyltransferase